jgi:transcription factor IIIB subunit 2
VAVTETGATGNQKIAQISAVLSINHAVIENSQGWFRLALQHNFLQGRHTDHVVAACVYIACRKAKTPHLLIDFSEVLQVPCFSRVVCSFFH